MRDGSLSVSHAHTTHFHTCPQKSVLRARSTRCLKTWMRAAAQLSEQIMAHGPLQPCSESLSNACLRRVINDHTLGPLAKTVTVKSARACCNPQGGLALITNPPPWGTSESQGQAGQGCPLCPPSAFTLLLLCHLRSPVPSLHPSRSLSYPVSC